MSVPAANSETPTTVADSGDGRPSAVDVARWAGRSERLRRRRFELLPLAGSTSAALALQGRAPGSKTAPAELAELISSIAEVGVLQPVLVEETTGDDGQLRRRLIAGERRLRACQWGAAHVPDNPHFAHLPAVVCPGPLTEAETRIWQLIENLAREDLQPGELAAALLYERSAVLADRLQAGDIEVPADVWRIEDPADRWAALDDHRRRHAPHTGAPWPDVLGRLGLQMRHETAARLVRAFRAMPDELSSDMDAHQISLATRLSYLRLDRGRRDAAAAIWEAVKRRDRPDLLAGALRTAVDHPNSSAEDALDHAEARQLAANEARRQALAGQEADTSEAPVDLHGPANYALTALRALTAGLRDGGTIDPYTAGSLQLVATELLDQLHKHNYGEGAKAEPVKRGGKTKAEAGEGVAA